MGHALLGISGTHALNPGNLLGCLSSDGLFTSPAFGPDADSMRSNSIFVSTFVAVPYENSPRILSGLIISYPWTG